MSVGKPVEIGRHPPSFMHTHSHLDCARERKEGHRRRTSVFGVLALMLGVWSLSLYETLFFGCCILVIYIEEVFAQFFPLGFPSVNCCVPCDYVSFSDPLYAVIVKMY